LKQNSGKKDKLFLLSWTLTPDAGTFADAMLNPFAKDSMREMCTEANPYLGDFVSTYAHLYKINVLYVDFCNLVDVTKFAMNANSQAIRVGNENDDSVLTSVSLATITHDDNKDHDTAIYAEIWTADGSTLIAKADGIENNTEYKDGPPSCHLVNIPLINKMTKRQCKEKAFTVKIKSKANGNDEWKFDTVVGLNFSDNVPMIANKDNIDLNSTRKHWWSSDSNFSDTATFGTVPKTPNPDLTIVNAAITSRTSNKITYTYTIKNTGTTTIPNLYNVVIQNYYSENTIFADAGDVPAGGSILGVSHSLAPGETYTGTFYSSVAVPSGMKYLTFKIDSSNSVAESDENNNTQALYIMYPDSSSSGVPDLTFTNASITSQTSSQVNYTYTIKNIGTATIPNLYNVSIQNFYSANTIFNDTGDIAAGGSILGVSRSLEPGETYTGTFHSLGAVPAGMKYLTFKIDFGDLVAESNENNNTEALAVTSSDPASSGLADLTFTNVSITSRTATMVNYTYTIKNIGTATIPSLYNVSIQNFYSANTIFNDAGDAAAGGRILGISRSLAPGESYTGTYTVSVPIPSGKPYITAQIDWGNIVSESNENNNTFSISIR
ncbi:MAG TPA: CARDB domain-containing protein, partial [Clostridia bacterium]